MAEKFFWADMIADKIIEKNKEKEIYVCASGITPSGVVHVGNFREVITTELVVRALKDKGKKVRFVYSWDDYDRFRKVPKNIKENFEKYLGKPICKVPSPFDEKKDYSRYFEEKFEQEIEKVGIEPEFIRQCEMYQKCKYAELIKKSLNEKKKIIKILNKYRKEPLNENWYPIKIYCEKCGKDFTKIISINEWKIKYSCECGNEEEFDFRKKGLIKLVWRVDWPMRWFYEKVDFEPGGADHSAPGSSFDTGKQIVNEVFDYLAPVYYMYQNVGIKGGEKFSSSKGNVLTLEELNEIYEPEIIRYLFAGTRPNKSFQISFDNDVIKIYEDYDALEKKYYDKKTNPWEMRIYEMSQIKDIKKTKPEKLGFRQLITYVQLGKENELNKDSKERAKKVKNWLKKYAGEDMKFVVVNKVTAKLNSSEKKAMQELRKLLEKKDYTDEEMFNEFYEICKKLGIKNTEFFDAAYRVLINKSKGPRLASLINLIGREKVIKLLEQVK